VVTGPNAIDASGTNSDGKPFEFALQVDGQRYKVITAMENGQTLAANGKMPNSDQPTPWVTKCGPQ
jgi:hypothetical protein